MLVTNGVSLIFTCRGIMLVKSGLDENLLPLMFVSLSCTGGRLVVPDLGKLERVDLFLPVLFLYFLEVAGGLNRVARSESAVAPCPEMTVRRVAVLLVGTCLVIALGRVVLFFAGNGLKQVPVLGVVS